ncbi:hypothetical protein BC332_28178 [Capsicum chinense]|nr:hypothetical protein BC332_28178 [Capsicum chinense]
MGEKLTKKVREKVLSNLLTFEVFVSASITFVLALIVAWRVAIALISIQPLLIASFYWQSVLMKTISERSQKAQSEGSQLASPAVINHRTITAFSSQDRMLDLFAKTPKGPRIENIRHSLLSDTGSITSDLARGSSVVASVFATLDGKTEIEPESPEGIKATKVSKGKIELKSVFFYYPSRPDQAIFQGINLKIESGKTVALVRRSGSGKSTIIGLIERFYDPIKGQVLIDDRDIIKSYNLKCL